MGRPRIVVLATGGTIATLADAPGRPLRAGAELLAAVPDLDRLADLTCRDVARLPSHLMTVGEMELVARAAVQEARRDDADGVVVLHGTDILEEAAFLTDLWHDGATPIVFTGAQRPADHPAADGPGNIRDAVVTAGSSGAGRSGVLVCLGGTVRPAVGATKHDTSSLDCFRGWPSPAGHVSGERLLGWGREARAAPLSPAPLHHRVELVRLAAGTSGALVRAACRSGARGVVLEAFGAGTAPADVVDAVAQGTQTGCVMLLATRCPQGGVWPQAGTGGSAQLVSAGALPAGDLDGAKARVLLLAALGLADGEAETARQVIADWLHTTGRDGAWEPRSA